jgi:hypothetical protein
MWNNKGQRSSRCNQGISKGMVNNIRAKFAHIIQNMKQHFIGYHPMVIDFHYINIIKHLFATFSFSENTFHQLINGREWISLMWISFHPWVMVFCLILMH